MSSVAATPLCSFLTEWRIGHWPIPISVNEWLKTREKTRHGGLPIVYRILLFLRLRELDVSFLPSW